MLFIVLLIFKNKSFSPLGFVTVQISTTLPFVSILDQPLIFSSSEKQIHNKSSSQIAYIKPKLSSLYTILSIPYYVDFNNQILIISDALNNFLRTLEKYLVIEGQLVYLMIGDLNDANMYGMSIWIPVRFIALVGSLLLLALFSYLISRPLFLKMVSKTIEKDAGITRSTKNVKHGKIFTFFNKELKVNIRNINVLGTLAVTYIITPILILLINKIFGAMDLSNLGRVMTCAFNILLICLPLLATNSLVASMYSKEGRAGYIKKTKPVKPYYPLLAKMSLSVILSIPSTMISLSLFLKLIFFKLKSSSSFL